MLSATKRARMKRALLSTGQACSHLSDSEIVDMYSAGGFPKIADEVPQPQRQEAPSSAPETKPKRGRPPKATTATAKPTPSKAPDGMADMLAKMVLDASEARIVELIGQHAGSASSVTVVDFCLPDREAVRVEGAHKKFSEVSRALKIAALTGACWPFLCGPAGSGKTTLAGQIAEALGIPFYAKESLQDKFELLGFVDANGNYQQSDLYRAYKDGGLFLFDEMDRSAPEAIVAFNMALSNGVYTFPNGEQVKRHKDCYFIAAGNTFGEERSDIYNTAQILDGSTRNRFLKIDVDYCETLENTLAHSAARSMNPEIHNDCVNEWIKIVRSARDFCKEYEIDAIFSPRQTVTGACYIADGMSLENTFLLISDGILTEKRLHQFRSKQE